MLAIQSLAECPKHTEIYFTFVLTLEFATSWRLLQVCENVHKSLALLKLKQCCRISLGKSHMFLLASILKQNLKQEKMS